MQDGGLFTKRQLPGVGVAGPGRAGGVNRTTQAGGVHVATALAVAAAAALDQ